MQNKELMIDGKTNKNIYYLNSAYFTIIPNLDSKNKTFLEKHINHLRDCYQKDNQTTFLWLYDNNKNAITIDNSTTSVESDIFYQFSMVALWLFSKNYDLKGYFFYRTDKLVEYISCDGIGKSITHYLIHDEIDALSINNQSNFGEKIMIDTENKINKFKQKKFFSLLNKENYLIKIEPLHSVANILVREEENQILIKAMQQRLELVENKVKSLKQINKSLWKICTIMGLVTIGTIIVYTFFIGENNSTFNNSTINEYNLTIPS